MIKTLIVSLVIGAIVWLILWLYPPLGKHLFTEPSERMKQSPQYRDGKFHNEIPTSMAIGFVDYIKTLWSFVIGGTDRKPDKPLPMMRFDPAERAKTEGVTVTWLGHSSILLNWQGKTILIDPMFGNSPTPFPWLAGNRYSKGLPFEVEQLPTVDAVFLSHDHYDHLDYGTIVRIKDKVKQFFVPLGVAGHLERWGVTPDRIIEKDWREEFVWEGITAACMPARHFSGRSLTDRFSTLWCSWVFLDQQTRVFYSGDSGFGPHFVEIGQKYGPFDMALIECGQYNELWKDIHLMPEEAVQAAIDVRAEQMIPVHWAAFTLALHEWYHPAEHVYQASQRSGLPIVTPQIGEAVRIDTDSYPNQLWWREAK